MTSAADIAAPGGTIQRAHELLVPIAIDHQLDECGRTSRRGAGVLRSFPDHWPSIFARTCRNDIVNRTLNAQKCDADHIRPPRSFHISRIKRYFRLEEGDTL